MNGNIGGRQVHHATTIDVRADVAQAHPWANPNFHTGIPNPVTERVVLSQILIAVGVYIAIEKGCDRVTLPCIDHRVEVLPVFESPL